MVVHPEELVFSSAACAGLALPVADLSHDLAVLAGFSLLGVPGSPFAAQGCSQQVSHPWC